VYVPLFSSLIPLICSFISFGIWSKFMSNTLTWIFATTTSQYFSIPSNHPSIWRQIKYANEEMSLNNQRNLSRTGARGSVVGWGTMLQAGRSPVRVQDEVVFSIYLILPAALWPWGLLSLQQKWVSGIFLGVKSGRGIRLTTLSPSVSRMSENVGASTSSNPKGLHGLYRDNFTFYRKSYYVRTFSHTRITLRHFSAVPNPFGRFIFSLLSLCLHDCVSVNPPY
jgi:hypothetical protein